MQVKKAIDIAKDKDLKIQSIERELYYDLINFFKDLIADYLGLYKTSGFNNEAFHDTYIPDIEFLLKKYYNKASKTFGYDARIVADFRYDNIVRKGVGDILIDIPTQEKINQLYDTLFIQERDEAIKQSAEAIIKTNKATFPSAIQSAENQVQQTLRLQDETTNNLQRQLIEVGAIANLLKRNNKANSLKKRIEKIVEKKEELLQTRQSVIQENFKKTIQPTLQNRATTISNTEAGRGESIATNSEYKAITNTQGTATVLGVKKSLATALEQYWADTRDGRVRPTHVIASGQVKGSIRTGGYLVGGYFCEYPRDWTLPAEESANCRCRSVNLWV